MTKEEILEKHGLLYKGQKIKEITSILAAMDEHALLACQKTLDKAAENAKFDHAYWMQVGAHRCNKSSITDPSNIVLP